MLIKNKKLVSIAHKYNLKVHPYTHRVDSLPEGFETSDELLNFLINDQRVDGVFTDFADVVLKYLK